MTTMPQLLLSRLAYAYASRCTTLLLLSSPRSYGWKAWKDWKGGRMPAVLLDISRPRRFTTTNNPPLRKTISKKNMPPRPKPPPEDEIEENFLKGSGAGGQKINKTNSAVQLKHLPTGIVVKSQATRSRSQNRAIARQLLADKLDDLTRGSESRASVVREVKRKKKASSAKKSRRKYRKLDEARAAAAAGGLEEEEEEDDGVDLDTDLPEEGSDKARDVDVDIDRTTHDSTALERGPNQARN
ncbi:RF-1 domain-containing protein [Nemania sp. FL0916]|nr:RF-1 domain-containing protein [Nemania sp. FL0916]